MPVRMRKPVWIALAIALVIPLWFAGLVLWSWSIRPPVGLVEDRLRPCPDKPNCVCSLATDAGQTIEPLLLSGDANAEWGRLRELVSRQPRTRIITFTENYLHAECATALMRYVDDLEFHLNPAERRIEVRSASRVGYSDLGANRKRVEALRAAWTSPSR